MDSTLSDREHGAFYAHQDADVSLDDDGSYYTWSLADLEAALPPARADQKAPFVETTKFTDRNGLMVSTYLDAYQTLGDTPARDFALTTLGLLIESAVQSDGTVLHATAEGDSYVAGFMADYAGIADALLDAYQVTGEDRYLRTAERVIERAVELFWDEDNGGFFDRPEDPDAPALLADRAKEYTDSPLPGDNAVAARALDKLYLLTSRERWHELAGKTLAAFAGAARDQGTFVGSYALAAEAHLNKPPQTVVIGPANDSRTAALAEAAWRTFRPGRMVASYDPTTVALESLPPAVAGAARVFGSDPTPRAYVCVGETCAPPTTEATQVAELVRDYGRVGER